MSGSSVRQIHFILRAAFDRAVRWRYLSVNTAAMAAAQCLEIDVASQGPTVDDALANLGEAVALYLDEIDEPDRHITRTPLVTSFQVPGAA